MYDGLTSVGIWILIMFDPDLFHKIRILDRSYGSSWCDFQQPQNKIRIRIIAKSADLRFLVYTFGSVLTIS
jgi:hypothetical protein